MESQIVQAVDIAAGSSSFGPAGRDPAIQQQALDFLNNVQNVPAECWSAGWNVFSAGVTTPSTTLEGEGQQRQQSGGTGAEGGQRNTHNARMFGLTLVTNYLLSADPNAPETVNSLHFLQEAILNYIHAEFVAGSAEAGMPFIKNKFAQAMTGLLMQVHLSPNPSPPTLLPQLLSLLRTHLPNSPSTSMSPPPLNAQTSDLILAALHDFSLALGSDVSLRSTKDKALLVRDAQVKDRIRAENAEQLAENIWMILEECLEKSRNGVSSANGMNPRQVNASNAADLLKKAALVAGDYASWLDITLMLTPRTIQLLLSVLHHPVPSVRTSGADALLDIVMKGMKPADKVELLQLLDLTIVIKRLEFNTRTPGTTRQMQQLGMIADENGYDAHQDHDSSQNVEFRERLAKLADGIAIELGKIIEENSSVETAPVRAAASDMLDAHIDLLLAFLADEDDGPAEQVLPCIHMVLTAYRKVKRKSETTQLSPQQSQFLRSLTAVTLTKMKYDADAEWKGPGSQDDEEDEEGADGDEENEEDDDEVAFAQLRKNLQTIVSNIASLDEHLFSTAAQRVIFGTLSRYENVSTSSQPSQQQPTWQEMEMAMYATFFFGEILSSVPGATRGGLTPHAFVNVAELPQQQSGKKAMGKLDQETLQGLPLNILGETISRLVQSTVSSFPHPAVQLQFFECLVRYSAFFSARPELLKQALVPFLDQRGIHHPKKGTRRRLNYLFSRFVRETRQQISDEFIPTILENITDVLAVKAKLPQVSEGEDPLLKATEKPGAFDSQLHLFDLSGTLLAILNAHPEKQAAIFPAIVEPLSSGLRAAIQRFESSNRTDIVQVLQAHHLILAMSNLAKGFPDATHMTSDDISEAPTWIGAFRSITEQIMAAVSSLRQYFIIRDAGRGAFARIVTTIGRAALPYVPTLLDAILSEMTSAELVDSINFLCLVVNKYKDDLRDMMDQLLMVLIQRVFYFLNQPVSGTDDEVARHAMQKAYIGFINSLVQSNLDGVLLSEQNQPELQTILQSLLYCATNNADKSCQRHAVVTFGGLVFKWGASLPGFDNFMFETLVPLVFETPAKTDFDLQDAQSQQVLGELAGLIKKIYATRGDELLDYLLNVYFPRINCPAEVAREMSAGLKTLDVKAYKRSLGQWCQLGR